MRVIILNGPPNIGKDTLGNNVQQLIGWPRMEFKEALYRETASYYGVDLVTFAMLASGRTTKEVPMPTLGGLSPRQAMIHVSEEVIKPKFGKQFFGAKAYELIQTLDGSTDTVKFYDASGNKYLAEVNGISVGHLYKTNPSKLIEQVKTVANNKEVSDFAI